MATPTRTHFRLTGPDGAVLAGDVRTAGAQHPAVVICRGSEAIAERVARAGFTAVSFVPRGRADVDAVTLALAGGTLGVTPHGIGILRTTDGVELDLEWGGDTARVASLDDAVAWLVRRLA